MLSERRVEEITGLRVDFLQTKAAGLFALGYRDGVGSPWAVGGSDTGDQAEALQLMFAHNWNRLHREVREEQRHLCAHCGKRGPLSLHHITHRSRGRNDRRENLEGLCVQCHGQKHGGRSAKKMFCDPILDPPPPPVERPRAHRRTVYELEGRYALHVDGPKDY